MSMYGNYNLAAVGNSQHLTVDGSTDFLTMSSNVQGLLCYSTADCWVAVGTGTVTAVKPSGEKVSTGSFFLPAATVREFAVPSSTDEKPVKVAAVQDSATGILHVQEWKLS